jgi:hypothetical protein
MSTSRASLIGYAALASLLIGCAGPTPPHGSTGADDGLSAPPDPEIARVSGTYDFWEDVEGGHSCDVTLEQTRTIGGHAFTADETCIAQLDLDGEPLAWFVASDVSIVFIDATRQRVLTFEALPDGTYYARRAARYSLNLTPPNPNRPDLDDDR